MWFKNIFIYRIRNWNLSKSDLETLLSLKKLRECSSIETKTKGWLPVKDDDELVHAANKQLLICLGMNKKLLPPSVVRSQVKARAKEIFIQQGSEIGRKQLKEIKEAVTDELLMKAFSIETKVYGWIDPVENWLVINTTSRSKADEFLQELNTIIKDTSISTLKTKSSPSKVMKSWLIAENSTQAFTIDQDCELSATGLDSRSVKYTGYSLDNNEIQKHIKEGMEVKKLALTWNNKISFNLENTLQLKRITPLDVIKEKYLDEDKEDLFNSEFAIMTGEFEQMFKNIIEALGGEV